MDNPKIGHIELDFEVKRETDMGLCNVELRALYIKPRKKIRSSLKKTACTLQQLSQVRWTAVILGLVFDFAPGIAA